jgi:alkylation response protein AidB-like acyl-CoA dehydrogenase
MSTTATGTLPAADHWEAALPAVLERIAARAAGHDRDGSFPHEAFAELHEIGLVGLTVPAALGGGGGDLRTAATVLERVAAADASVGLVLLWQFALQADLADEANRWPAELRERVQRSAVEDGALVNALRVEPDLGSPARGGVPATTVRSDAGGGLRLHGHKIYSTGIPALRWLVVWAATEEDDVRTGSFLVERGDPGVRVEETWDHFGMRASGTHDTIFEGAVAHELDVRRPEEWRTADAGPVLAWATVLMAATYTGIAVAARDWLTAYLNERTPTNLGAPLASLPQFQQAVGEIETLIEINHTLIRDVATGIDNGLPGAPDRAPLTKHVATENAIVALDIALRLTGNPGLMRANPLERHHRDALTGRVHVPQRDMVLGALGRSALSDKATGLRVNG